MSSQKLAVVGVDDPNQRRRQVETINEITSFQFDDSRRRTEAERAALVTPTNYAYPPGHLYRYGTNTTPGTTDMTTALTNALAANNVVRLPGESILISSAISVTDNKTIIGEGSNKTFIVCSANTFNAFSLASNARRIFLRYFAITSPSIGASNAAIAMNLTVGVGQSEFKDLQINDFFTGILWGEEFWDSSVINVRCNSCARGAFTAGTGGQSINVLWRRFYSEGHTTIGMQLSGVKTYTLIDCNFGGEQGGGESQALYCTTNSHVHAQGSNFEFHEVLANDGVVEVDSACQVILENCTFAGNSGASATGYNLLVAGTAVVHLKNTIEVSNGSNLASVRLLNTAQLVKHDDHIPASGIVHAAGTTATTVVRSPYQARPFHSDQIDLSGAAAARLIYVPKRSGRITRIAAIYPEATSADAGITLVVRTDDSALTYASFTSHASQAAWDVQEITLGTTEIDPTRPIVFASPGGKTGTGEVIMVIEVNED